MRVTVGMVVGQIGYGRSVNDIRTNYPCLEHTDIMQALQYAAWQANAPEDETHQVTVVAVRTKQQLSYYYSIFM